MKKFAPPVILCALLAVISIASCDLFTGPKVDVLQKISDEKRWADAPKLEVRVEFPSMWGTSKPQQGKITPAMDIRLDYEFSVEFIPDSIYSLQAWVAYFTEDLEGLADNGSWVENPDLIANVKSLGPEEITLPEIVQSGGAFNFTIHTVKPVTLVPSCDTRPRVTRTEPLDNRVTSEPVPRASDIVLYFNSALSRDTVISADEAGGNGVWITADTGENNKDQKWYGDPEYAAVGGFFTVTMYCLTMPPADSLMTLTVNGIESAQGELMDKAGYSFSWNTSSANEVYFKSWSAKYNHNPNNNSGTIEIEYEQTGAEADGVKIFYRLNKGAKIEFNGSIINNVSGPDYSGVRTGGQITGIREYEIIIELYAEEIMENKVSIKIWNIPGMEVSKEDPAVEVSTAEGLAAINGNLGGQYVLTKDITVTGEWIPVGTSTPFTGKFYGNGRTITFTSDSSIGGTNYIGLFGYAQGSPDSQPAVIRDFTFNYNSPDKNINIDKNYYIGGVAGYLKDTAVSNVTTSGGTLSITASSGSSYNYVRLGGIAGHIEGSGIIENCRATLSVKYTSSGHSGGINIGVLAGETGEGNTAKTIKISNGFKKGASDEGPDVTLKRLLVNGVTVSADVSASKGANSGEITIGGAVGQSGQNTMNDITFTDGTVSFYGGSIICGGIVGGFVEANITESYFSGNIKTTDGNDNIKKDSSIDLGGLIGRIKSDALDEYYFIDKCRVRTNIGLKGFHYNKVGGVLGSTYTKSKSEGAITVTNCFFDGGEINVKDSADIQLGGFSGFSMGGGDNIFNCGVLSGTITVDANIGNDAQGKIEAGGFIGEFFPSDDTRPYNVSNCFSKINIITTGACQHLVGGFISTIKDDNISNCYATGTVSAIIDGDGGNGSSNIGGLVGYSLGKVENSYALGNVFVDYSGDKENEVYAGGLVGSIVNEEGNVSYCFSAGRVSANSNSNSNVYSGGIVGSNGGVINHTAALGASVTAKGREPDPSPDDYHGPTVYRFIGRIWGSNNYTDPDYNNNNYALNKMIIEEGEYDSINPDTRDANVGLSTPFHATRDGQDASSSTFLNQSFWRTTLHFDQDVWDFSRVARDGHPKLKNVEGQ